MPSRHCLAVLPFLCCDWKSARGCLRLWRNQEPQVTVKSFMQVNKSKVPRGDIWALAEPTRCRATPFTPATEPLQMVGCWFWILQAVSPEGWWPNCWGRELHKGLCRREMNLAAQVKSIQHNMLRLEDAQRPKSKAGSTEQDYGRWALGGTGSSATPQWRSTSFFAPAPGKEN